MMIDIKQYLKSPKGIIQVGAHEGQEVELLLSLTDNCIFIEPQQEPFNKLAEKAGSKAYQSLIGSANGEVDFYIASNSQCSSISQDGRSQGVSFVDKESMLMVTLPNFLKDKRISTHFDTLLIDAEGSEVAILDGTRSLLNDFEYVMLEWNVAYQNTYDFLKGYMHAKGFTLIAEGTVDHQRRYGDMLFQKAA